MNAFAIALVAALGMSLLTGSSGASPGRGGTPKGLVLPNNVLQVDWDELLPPGAADRPDTSSPPPPNQIVFVHASKPFLVKDGTNAYWITGQMRVERKRTDMASASYSMAASKVEGYP